MIACNLHLVHGPNPHTRAQGLDTLVQHHHGQPCAVLASAELLPLLNQHQTQQRHQQDQQHKDHGVHWLRLLPGCPCCSSKLVLATHLGRTLRLIQPTVLFLELDSQSHPDAVWELLQQPQWQGWFCTLQNHNFGLTQTCPISTLEIDPQNPI